MHTKFYILQSVHRVPESLSDSLNKKGGDYPPFSYSCLRGFYASYTTVSRSLPRTKARQRAATVQKRKRLIIEVAENPVAAHRPRTETQAQVICTRSCIRTNDKPGQASAAALKN
nr:hypothetical protein [Escherichia coli]